MQCCALVIAFLRGLCGTTREPLIGGKGDLELYHWSGGYGSAFLPLFLGGLNPRIFSFFITLTVILYRFRTGYRFIYF